MGLLVIIDDWFIRPRRQVAASPQPPVDPPLMRTAYMLLPLFIGAAVLRLLLAERLDFSSVLFGITALTGVVWLLDVALLRPRRVKAARAAGKDPALIPEPGTVDYARSFFPVALVVLVLRSFIFEPFRIPSDSMMPTLLDGDFIIVNKYAYGLRLPVINRKIIPVGSPQRGDVVVFRYPRDPSVNYIKRLVGLPGDHVVVRSGGDEAAGSPTVDAMEAPAFETTVPPGSYFMMGDNRDNSEDGRVWGFVPEDNLVGKATRIWFNWDLKRTGGPAWSRLGSAIK